MKAKANRPAQKTLPSLNIFGPPPIIHGEDAAVFDELMLQASTALKPVDVVDHILVDDVVRSTWETIRGHRLKNALLKRTAYQALAKVLQPLIYPLADYSDALQRDLIQQQRRRNELITERWLNNDPDAREEVDALLQRAGLTMHEVMAEALAMKLPEIAAIDSLIDAANARRLSALHELDRRRLFIAEAARLFSDNALEPHASPALIGNEVIESSVSESATGVAHEAESSDIASATTNESSAKAA